MAGNLDFRVVQDWFSDHCNEDFELDHRIEVFVSRSITRIWLNVWDTELDAAHTHYYGDIPVVFQGEFEEQLRFASSLLIKRDIDWPLSVQTTNLLKWIQASPSRSLTISSVNNPGWTLLASFDAPPPLKEPLHTPTPEDNTGFTEWIHYISDSVHFNGGCGPWQLTRMLDDFTDWIT